jgi:hypothetical protein
MTIGITSVTIWFRIWIGINTEIRLRIRIGIKAMPIIIGD